MPDLTPPDAVADVVVVGAGQAGLAVAAHLARSGFVPAGERGGPTYVVLDAAPGPGGAWRERWPGLTMRTVNGVYELPGRALPRFAPDEPASRALTRYFGDYERDLGLAVRRPVQVRAVRDAGGPGRWLAVETVERPGPGAAPAPESGPGAPPVHARRAAPDPDDALGCGAGAARPVPAPPRPGADGPAAGAATSGAATSGAAPSGALTTPGAATPAAHVPGAAGAGERPRRRVARTWHARAVVNATGTWTRPFWPSVPGRDVFAGTQLHTHDYRTPEQLAGRRVLVVGGGISAVQHLLAVHPVAASTTWVTRRPPDWRDEEFSPELGRAAVARVAERTAAGLPPGSIVSATGLPMTAEYRAGIASGVLRARPLFARLVPDGAVWDDAAVRGPLADGWVTGPAHVPADVVLWATGFRPALDHLRPLGLRTPDGGVLLDGTAAVADPRVQLVGYGPSASTVGANRAGREAVRRVRALLGL